MGKMLFWVSFTIIYSFISAAHRYLLVNFCKLVQVVFEKGNLLFLGDISPTIILLHLCTLSTEKAQIF